MRRTTRIYCASSLFAGATLAAALDAGLFPPAGRQVLLVSNAAATPEVAPAPDALPGFAAVRARFDEVISWNETVAPFHPGGWSPRGDDSPLWERHMRRLWSLGDDTVELVVESVESPPGLALAGLFPDAPVEVCSGVLAGYAPTSAKLDGLVGTRVRRLLYAELVPGLRPLALSEFGVPTATVPAEALRAVLDEIARATPAGPHVGDPHDQERDRPALLLGQPLSALEITGAAQEERLYLRMVRGAVALGHRRLVFAPHPGAPVRWGRTLEEEAAVLGAEVTLRDTPVAAEALFTALRPALVVGCSSTALLSAATLYGIPVARVGTEDLLTGLTPYEHPHRTPLTVVDALLPDLEVPEEVAGWRMPEPADASGTVARVSALLDAVAFCMHPKTYPDLRPAAEAYLTAHLDLRTARYFRRRRLAALTLPGGLPAQLNSLARNPRVRRAARRARAMAGSSSS